MNITIKKNDKIVFQHLADLTVESDVEKEIQIAIHTVLTKNPGERLINASISIS